MKFGKKFKIPSKHSKQQMLIVKIREYVYLVPFVEDEEVKFVKCGLIFHGFVIKYASNAAFKRKNNAAYHT